MKHYCLDFCTLLNLYCGWGGIQELKSFGSSWSISNTAFEEFTYARAFDANGSVQNIGVDRAALLRQYSLNVHTLNGAGELATFLDLSQIVDDGEAASLAIAAHRSLIFVSDDSPALRAALTLNVQTVSTPDLLIEWAGSDPSRNNQLPVIVKTIGILAKFAPAKSSQHRSWWSHMLGLSGAPSFNAGSQHFDAACDPAAPSSQRALA